MEAADLSLEELAACLDLSPRSLQRRRREGRLAHAWRQTPAPAERRRREVILVVPSALAPDETNWLLNPEHPDFSRVRIHPPEP